MIHCFEAAGESDVCDVCVYICMYMYTRTALDMYTCMSVYPSGKGVELISTYWCSISWPTLPFPAAWLPLVLTSVTPSLCRNKRMGTNWEQEWEQSGNKNPKVGHEWRESGNKNPKVGQQWEQESKSGTTIGTKWEQEPESGTRIRTRWEQKSKSWTSMGTK